MASPRKPSAPTDAPPSEPKPIAAAVEAALQPASAPEVVHDDPVDRDTMGAPQDFESTPKKNPRNEVLARIAGQAAEVQGHDERLGLDESGDRPRLIVNEGGTRRTVESTTAHIDDNGVTRLIAEAGQELPPIEEETPPDPTPEPSPPPTVRVPVLGQEQEFTAEQVYQAGIAALGKQSAADIRLREASALLDEAQRIRDGAATSGRAEPPPPAASGAPNATPADAAALADALIRGDRDETTRALAQMMDRGVNAESLQALVSQTAATQVNEVLSHREAVSQLHNWVPELDSDPYFKSMAATIERNIRMSDTRQGVRRSYMDVYADVARSINGFKSRYGIGGNPTPQANTGGNGSGNGGGTLQMRQQAKAATPAPVVGTGGRPGPVASAKPPSGSQVIAQMREKRGQGRARI